jgi:hypothetical protein
MQNRKGINFFLGIIAIILGWTLFKHIDFATFTLADPVLDILYLAILVICIYLIIRDRRK